MEDKTENSPLKPFEELPPKQQAYVVIRREGLNQQDAAKAVGFSKSRGNQLDKELGKYDLTDIKMVSKAHKRLDNILDGKTWGRIKEIKDSTALQAIGMVVDRHQPKVTQNVNLNLNAKIDPVDLRKYGLGGTTCSGQDDNQGDSPK